MSSTSKPTETELPPRALQELWFATLRRPWISLVVMPVGLGVGSRDVGQALARVGMIQRGEPVRWLDACRVALADVSRVVEEMHRPSEPGERVVVSADSILENQAAVPLVLGSDAVLLCVELGRTRHEEVDRTLERVGRERVIGCVSVPGEWL